MAELRIVARVDHRENHTILVAYIHFMLHSHTGLGWRYYPVEVVRLRT